jgi:hypothetical protein
MTFSREQRTAEAMNNKKRNTPALAERSLEMQEALPTIRGVWNIGRLIGLPGYNYLI